MGKETEKVFNLLKKMKHFDRLKFICLYGSQIAKGATKESDIDICLYYDIKNKRALQNLLYKIKGSLPERFDVQMFQLLPLFIRKEIFGGHFVYQKNKAMIYDLAFKTFADYREFEPRYKFYILNTKEHPRRFVL